ncbi:MAG: peptide chain release factor N(5)-glutamine methyltransferase [Thermoanaerobaculia bacterium]|nr:peptide chain release factor N(5)-glutamine methyltransferase [Thermoanaerobaculia bacterium]
MTDPTRPSAGALLGEGRRGLAAAPFRPPPREAALLLARTLGVSEASLMAHPERPVAAAAAARFRELLARRLEGEPVAYLLGVREFYGRSFRVDRRVLIPRPETELLVETALSLPLPGTPSILDVGTGSGAIALTLALELPAARVTATDLSPAALAVAAGNARALEAPVGLVAADLAAGLLLERFDLVASNPPYVGRHEAAGMSREILDFEPERALFADDGGRRVIRRLLAGLDGLGRGAWLLLEIGAGQAAAVEKLARRSPFDLVEIRLDLAGIPRVALLRRAR